MNVRQRIERAEHTMLKETATFADSTRGRREELEPCSYRTEFQRDRDRVLHSKAFRRLKHKTQVFISPEGDHYRTRLTHTLEVSQIARTIARALCLNEDLTEVIALGHDLGHTPFGHAGEIVLAEICPHGFDHATHGLRVVRYLEEDGKGLNLTYEVEDGIANHNGDRRAQTLEGRIVHYADRIAYINHDIDDSIRAGILTGKDIPAPIRKTLGNNYSKRINTLVGSIISQSESTGKIGLSPEDNAAMLSLRQFMFDEVYTNPLAKGEESKVKNILQKLYEYFYNHTDKLPLESRFFIEKDGKDQIVCDYIAGMTDRYAVAMFHELFVPKGWKIL